MTGTYFHLLEDALIEVADDPSSESSRFVDLPTVLERLGNDRDLELPGLQAHHQHPWHAFLVQLAGLALHRAGETDPALGADAWRERLLALTPDPSAWCLVVDALDRPAFLQPPVPEKSLAKLKNTTPHPDRLDLLVTAKNHEVKAETVDAEDPLDAARHLLPILITYQTFNGFSGRGNYGIARMNGGFASRPCVCVTPDLRWSTRFRRDLDVLQKIRAKVVDEMGFADSGGHALLWLLPWSGEPKEILQIEQLDPWFLEIGRRVRTTVENGELLLHYGPTNSARVEAKERLGNLGDPWTPVRRKDGATLTLSDNGFHYRLVTDLLFSDGLYDKAPAQRFSQEDPRDDPQDMIAVFMALVRGQGKTGGYHERYVLIPGSEHGWVRDEDLAELAVLAEERIKITADVQRKLLKPALLALMQGGTRDLNFKDGRAQPWLNRFDREVDRIFFPHLFDDAELDPEAQDERWQTTLWHLAQNLFEEAVDVLPRNLARAPKAVAQASSFFRFKARSVLPYSPAAQKPRDSREEEGTAA